VALNWKKDGGSQAVEISEVAGSKHTVKSEVNRFNPRALLRHCFGRVPLIGKEGDESALAGSATSSNIAATKLAIQLLLVTRVTGNAAIPPGRLRIPIFRC
jgi:hypothetical protein